MNRIYFGTEAGHFYALERKDGWNIQVIWDFKTPGRIRMSGPPIGAGDRIFFPAANGKVYVFEER